MTPPEVPVAAAAVDELAVDMVPSQTTNAASTFWSAAIFSSVNKWRIACLTLLSFVALC